MTTELEKDLVLGGMAVPPVPQPLVLWQMLLAHKNSHLQAHLPSLPASLAPGCTPISLLLVQPDLCCSRAPTLDSADPALLLCAHSPVCVSTVSSGLHLLSFLLRTSASASSLCSKPALPLGQL